MKVNIEEIQKIMSLLLSKLKESKGDEIELNSDFYWDISMEEIYDPYNEPRNISLGQLTDDYDELKRLLKMDHAIPYDIKRIANILTALSKENQTAF